MKPTAYSFIRFSTPEQAKGDSLRRQQQLATDWSNRNKIPLDQTLKLHDLGVSAFTGKHRENPDRHALATFLKGVETGKIRSGSYLLVENLDRLTREDIVPAVGLLINLLESGIVVVQLSPVETVFDSKIDLPKLMLALIDLSRGHSESKMKSERVGKAWSNKKKNAQTKLVTKRLPAWLKADDSGKIIVIKDSAKMVKQIYAMAKSGLGMETITKRLNSDLTKYPVIGTIGNWAGSTVGKILKNPAVYGLYQPHKRVNGKRIHDGPPIDNYFPVVISKTEYDIVQFGLAGRKLQKGRNSAKVNLFKGLLFSADTGCPIIYNSGHKKAPAFLEPAYSALGLAGNRTIFPLVPFEAGFLKAISEINPAELLPNTDSSADDLVLAERNFADCQAKIKKLQTKIADTGNIEAYGPALEKCVQEKNDTAKIVEHLKSKANNPVVAKWGNAQSIIAALGDKIEDEEIRINLRSAIRAIIEKAYCLFNRIGAKQYAIVYIQFKETNKERMVFIYWKRGQKGNSARPADINPQFGFDAMKIKKSLAEAFPSAQNCKILMSHLDSRVAQLGK